MFLFLDWGDKNIEVKKKNTEKGKKKTNLFLSAQKYFYDEL